MTAAVQPNYDAAVDFLRWWCPEGPWVLTAIATSKKDIVTTTFEAHQEKELRAWLESHGSAKNLYFSVNPVLRLVGKKPSREDVKALAWLHVDVDPRAGEDVASEQQRIEKLFHHELPPGVKPPSCVVFSGGGYQGFWRLEDPLEIGGRLDLAEDAKRYNLQLELLFGGDNCHNVDRIMRLPGSVNRPDEKKRAKGRTEALAAVVSRSEERYLLKDFVPAPQVQTSAAGFSANKVTVSGNVRRLASVDELPEGVPGQCKVLIVQGNDPDEPNKWPSRSERLFYVCCELVRRGCDDDTIFSVITDPTFGISGSVLEKGSSATRYALRQIERARENAIDPWLRQLNEEYAVVMAGGKCRVITEKEEVVGDQRRSRLSYMTFEDFSNYYSNKFVEMTTTKGDLAKMPVGKWWLHHPNRREFKAVVFAPGHDVADCFNLWKGFAFEARPGADCSLYLQHVRDNVCSGSQEHFDYLIRWMASAVQRPAQQGHTAIVLRGRQGTGKGVFAGTFGALFGRHYLTVRDTNHLFGQFNAHLRDCVVLFADEAFWAGSKKHEGMLKSLVTEDTVMCEAKGVDAVVATNYVHLIMASNEEWVVPAGMDDRRFLVLDVGEGKMQNASFFRELKDQMARGGYEALLHYLMSLDLSDFEVRKVPKTEALRDQKLLSLSAEHEWWFAKLRDGRVLPEHDGWHENVFTTALTFDYTSYCRAWMTNGRGNSTKLGMFLRQVLPSLGNAQARGKHPVMQFDGTIRQVNRPHVFVMPTLEECRAYWDKHFGGPYEWPKVLEVEMKQSKPEPF